MASIGSVLDWARQQVVSRVPKADLDQRDPDFIRDQLPGTWLLASLYFRADVRGLDRIRPSRRPGGVGGRRLGARQAADGGAGGGVVRRDDRSGGVVHLRDAFERV